MEQERREFLEMVRELSTLGQVAGMLGWDEQTYMPPGSARNRARQTAEIASVIHRYLTSERMGRLKTEETPAVWNERYEHYLGLEVPDHANGCLQDMHWAIGLYGYFPTYTLGILYAAQLWDAAKRQVPGLEDRIAAGDLGALLGWLRENVHRYGKRYDSATLIKKATGREIGEGCFIDYIKKKYGPLYGITL